MKNRNWWALTVGSATLLAAAVMFWPGRARLRAVLSDSIAGGAPPRVAASVVPSADQVHASGDAESKRLGQPGAVSRQTGLVFGEVGPVRIDDIPAGRFRIRLQQLSPEARDFALGKLGALHVPINNLPSLWVTESGRLYYRCAKPADLGITTEVRTLAAAISSSASVPVTSPPVLHSRPGAGKVVYLDFQGYTVTNTEWNLADGDQPAVTAYVCVPYSTDGDLTTFSDVEQAAIALVFNRVAEDFRPFDVDVTTERPAVFGRRTAHVLITRNTDANAVNNPSHTSGGVAIVDVFGDVNYPRYSPAFVYANNLGNADNVAEAAAHEAGHNLGLIHDGTASLAYYLGHGSGTLSWGPIMGAAYGKNISQWSKGEYYGANNTEDDLAIIAAKLSYRAADTTGAALTVAGSVIAGSGVIESGGNVDRFTLTVGAGVLSLSVTPSTSGLTTSGIDLKPLLELRTSSGALLASSTPASDDVASGTVSATVAAGTYYVDVSPTGYGAPLTSSPTGFTAYASLGSYAVAGAIVLAPVIGDGPSDQTLPAGGTVFFSVSATGAAPLVYRWKKGGADLVDDGRITGANTANLTISGLTAADAGSYSAVVSNSAGSASSAAAVLTVQSTFAQFTALSFTSAERDDPAISGGAADPDGDGVANLLEFATGQDPRANDPAGWPVVGNDGGKLTLSYLQRTDLADLTTQVEVSSDLVNWSSGAAQTELTASTSVGANLVRRTVRDLTPLAAGARRFMRLRVTLASPAVNVTTPPMGAVTINFPNGTRLTGMPLVNAAVARDRVGAHTASTMTLPDIANVGALLTGASSYFVEITAGPATAYVGERFEIDVAATKTSADHTLTVVASSPRGTLATLPANSALVGCTAVIRPHVTLGQLFGTKGTTLMSGSTIASSADQIQFLNPQTQGFEIFYLLRNNTGSIEQWTKVGGGGANQETLPIASGVGLVVVRNGAAPVTLSWLGEVRQNVFVQPLAAGNNLVSQPFPVDLSPAARAMTYANGFAGSTIASSADQLQVYAAGGFQIYYLLRNSSGSLEQWTKVGGGSTNYSQVALMGGDASVVIRKMSVDTLYFVPLPLMLQP